MLKLQLFKNLPNAVSHTLHNSTKRALTRKLKTKFMTPVTTANSTEKVIPVSYYYQLLASQQLYTFDIISNFFK